VKLLSDQNKLAANCDCKKTTNFCHKSVWKKSKLEWLITIRRIHERCHCSLQQRSRL